MGAIRKAGVEFYPGVGVSPDLTGLANTMSAKYKLHGSATYTNVSAPFVENNPGTYSVPVTISAVGDYQFIIESTDSNIENLEGNILVTAASIDDVNNAVTNLQSDIDSIKTQVDLLDEASVNNIGSQLTNVSKTVDQIKTLIDNDNYGYTVPSDVTLEFTVGELVEDPSNTPETAVVKQSRFDSVANVTYITLEDETALWNDGTTTMKIGPQTFTSTFVANPLDSVMEFVQAINDSLGTGGGSLSAIAGYTDNLELMLEGKAYTDTTGNPVDATTSKGLIEIFDRIVATETDAANNLTTLRGDITTLSNKVDTQTTTLTNTIESNKTTIITDLNAVYTIVNANKAFLENGTSGLTAIKNAIDTLSTDVSDSETNLTAILNDNTNGLTAIKSAILNKLDLMDAKLDNIGGATGSRIFL